MTAGSASLRAAETVIAKGRAVAAKALDVAEDEVSYRDGYFEVAGTDHRLSLFDAAARAKDMAARGEIAETLDTHATIDVPPTYPNGCHIAEVEVDPDTGAVTAISYTAVDDSGRLLDHTLVQGQLHGGIAQGLGQALMELGYYDPDNGQLVTGSFQDYAMPRAEDMPPIQIGSAYGPRHHQSARRQRRRRSRHHRLARRADECRRRRDPGRCRRRARHARDGGKGMAQRAGRRSNNSGGDVLVRSFPAPISGLPEIGTVEWHKSDRSDLCAGIRRCGVGACNSGSPLSRG